MRIFTIHGNSGSTEHFGALEHELKECDFKHFPIPLHPHGEEFPRNKKVSLSLLAENFVAFIEKNYERQEFLILGHSLGGNIAYHALSKLKRAAIGIITIGAPPLGEDSSCLSKMFLPEPLSRLFQNESFTCEEINSFQEINNLSKDSIVHKSFIRTKPRFRLEFIESILRESFQNELEVLKFIKTPTYLLNGERDPFISSAYLKEICENQKNMKFISLKNLHHYPMLEDPSSLAEVIRGIIEELKK